MTASTGTQLDDYRWLVSPEGAHWLGMAQSLDQHSVASVNRLRGQLSPERTHLVLEQVRLRDKAREVYPLAKNVLHGPGAEQATDEAIAAHKRAALRQRRAFFRSLLRYRRRSDRASLPRPSDRLRSRSDRRAARRCQRANPRRRRGRSLSRCARLRRQHARHDGLRCLAHRSRSSSARPAHDARRAARSRRGRS